MSNPKICVIGRADCCGLGSMAEDWITGMAPDKIVIIDPENGRPLTLPAKPTPQVARWRIWASTVSIVRRALQGIDVVVGFETFYRDDLPDIARSMGIKSVLFPMWEWSPDTQAGHSDIHIYLSKTDLRYYAQFPMPHVTRTAYDWPASPHVNDPNRKLHWPPRHFLHLAGNASHNRNGTKEVIAAAKHLRGTGARLLVSASFDAAAVFGHSDDVVYTPLSPSRREAYSEADVLVFPRRIGGHSLPINEAAGEGIPTIVLDLEDWSRWPYRIGGVPDEPFAKTRDGKPVPAWRANPDELGQLMRAMALGQVELQPGPRMPTWVEFRQWFDKLITA